MLEIGAHVGVVAMALARKYGVKVLAFEPMPENARALSENITVNRLAGLITVVPEAVTADGRTIRMIGNLTDNSGGATACLGDMYPPGCAGHDNIPSVAINDIFSRYFPEGRIKLVKIDCEGSEHEILNAISPENLERIENLRGEFHINSRLEQQGYSVERTFARCAAFIDPSRMSIKEIRMCE